MAPVLPFLKKAKIITGLLKKKRKTNRRKKITKKKKKMVHFLNLFFLGRGAHSKEGKGVIGNVLKEYIESNEVLYFDFKYLFLHFIYFFFFTGNSLGKS